MTLTLKDLRKIEINGKKLKPESYFVMTRDVIKFTEYFYDELKYLDCIDEEQYLEIVKLHKKVFNL